MKGVESVEIEIVRLPHGQGLQLPDYATAAAAGAGVAAGAVGGFWAMAENAATRTARLATIDNGRIISVVSPGFGGAPRRRGARSCKYSDARCRVHPVMTEPQARHRCECMRRA